MGVRKMTCILHHGGYVSGSCHLREMVTATIIGIVSSSWRVYILTVHISGSVCWADLKSRTKRMGQCCLRLIQSDVFAPCHDCLMINLSCSIHRSRLVAAANTLANQLPNCKDFLNIHYALATRWKLIIRGSSGSFASVQFHAIVMATLRIALIIRQRRRRNIQLFEGNTGEEARDRPPSQLSNLAKVCYPALNRLDRLHFINHFQ